MIAFYNKNALATSMLLEPAISGADNLRGIFAAAIYFATAT